MQYKIARNGGEVVRMDILVGDETRSYFPVTIWQKQMGSQVLAGHVFLLQSMLFVVVIMSIIISLLLVHHFVIIMVMVTIGMIVFPVVVN